MHSLLYLLIFGSVARGISQTFFNHDLDSWNLDVGPSPNSTGNLVFETVTSLLQNWPSRKYRNGHTIVPGILPLGTLLYHGRADSHLPTTPEWVAFDPELSSLYCGIFGSLETGCWQLTLVTVRPLKVLYFDGYSGFKYPNGTLDSQDVVSWGKVTPEWHGEEYRRINDLCEWGKPFGLDGFVRLHTLFEVMLCDFTAGVQTQSFLNLELPYKFPLEPPPSPTYDFKHAPNVSDTSPPPTPTTSIPLNLFGMHELTAVLRHNRYPGESRVQLDLSRLVSFYDISLVPSLVTRRFRQTRLQHRLLGISPADIDAVRLRLKEELSANKWSLDGAQSLSGIDWKTLFRTIIDNYADSLEFVQYLLNSTNDSRSNYSQSLSVFHRLQGILQPYNIRSAKPLVASAADSNLNRSWASPVYQLCSTSFTRHISSIEMLTASETLMLDAVQATNREICRVLTRMWASGVANGLDKRRPSDARVGPLPTSVLLKQWKEEIDGLMTWLDWSVWLKCKPACTFEEMCYLPIHPYTYPDTEEWNHLRPKCIPKNLD